MSLSSPRRSPSLAVKIIAVILLLALIYGAYHWWSKPAATDGQAQGAMPVEVITTKEESFRIWNDFSGRITAVDSVEIRPQVPGIITEIKFTEGSEVQAGDVLFVIDPRPYQAAYDQALAALNAARSQANLANVELKRAQSLVKQQFLSKSNYDQRVSSARVANSSIAQAEANAKQAKLNLDYAYVKAPISGQVGRPEITLGNLVQAGANATKLTTIVANKQMYAEFDVDEQTYVDYMRLKNDQQPMPVSLYLSGDTTQDKAIYQGVLQSFDNQLNNQSGTIRARAVFDNSDGTLIPGMYATVRLGSASEVQGILLTERAIGTDQDRRFVYVVGEDNKTAYREVTLGNNVGDKRVITSGLKAGERVVATGLQKIRPQMPVEPKEAEDANKTAAPAAEPQETTDGATTPANEPTAVSDDAAATPAATPAEPEEELPLPPVPPSEDGEQQSSEPTDQ